MKIIPQGDTVLIEWMQTTAGSIQLPDNLPMGDMLWKVVDTGPGRVLNSGALLPLPFKAGDVIVLSQSRGIKSLLPLHLTDDRRMVIADREAILAVIENYKPNAPRIRRPTVAEAAAIQ